MRRKEVGREEEKRQKAKGGGKTWKEKQGEVCV